MIEKYQQSLTKSYLCILFGNRNKYHISSNLNIAQDNTFIERINTFKFLDVVIDDKLSLKFQFDEIVRKVSRSIRVWMLEIIEMLSHAYLSYVSNLQARTIGPTTASTITTVTTAT